MAEPEKPTASAEAAPGAGAAPGGGRWKTWALVVSQTRDPRFSRMTIGISGHPEGLHQIIMQVNKLIDVMHCQEHTDRDAVAKEMILVKIAAGPDHRTEILQIVEHYGGKTVDLQEDSLIAMLSGNTDKIDAAVRLLGKFEIIETVRTGKVVMARGVAETRACLKEFARIMPSR